MIDLYQELALLLDELRGADVEYALCGALALAVHGVPRATKDLDLIVRREDEEKLRTAVRRAGYAFEALPMTFASGVELQRFTKLVAGQPLMLDVLWATGPVAAIWTDRQRTDWRGTELWVVSRRALITLKLTAGRPQDLADVQALAALEHRNGPA